MKQVSKLSFLFFIQIYVWLSDPSLDQRPIGKKSDKKSEGQCQENKSVLIVGFFLSNLLLIIR
jgi:hypothetical protein